ncbi:bile acid:sodium symporter family protein [Alloalcanivorax mobilis]|uniref:bile acid:sodium symporter family protein n=1 Tax=Alloalcanivorax mobilis TaxID=2019569 RepID=UPI000B5B39EA|nr:bile acid:sodium symporter family protein [Alloalcanivorax mobilis]ASK35327.1 bile acid:sodium symporter [Alcanivorax sp. N3-2A]
MKHLDRFTLVLMAAIGLASLWPARGTLAEVLAPAASVAVALLFFVHGAALSRQQVRAGALHWRLHVLITALTFVLFPLLVLPIGLLAPHWIPEDLALGFLYLGALPSAVSSSIAFTALARGNVPAAVCSAAASNVFGMMLTPFLLMLLVSSGGAGGFDLAAAFRDIVIQLLLPFALGQVLRPWLAAWLDRRKTLATRFDQAVILLIVYVAFSESVVEGLWRHLPVSAIAVALVLCVLLLALVMTLTVLLTRRLGFARQDEIAAVFCGSKKSLASGLPMAKVLFAGHPGFGMIVLPIMCYNQIQILVGAILAGRYARAGAGANKCE